MMEALAQTQLSGYESRILWALLRKTWGWIDRAKDGKIKRDKKGKPLKKKTAVISSKEWIKLTGLNKYNVSRTLRELVLRQIVIKIDNRNEWGPQKYYNKWLQPIKKIVIKNDNTYFVVKNDNVFVKNDNGIIEIDNKKTPKELIIKKHGSPKETLKETLKEKRRSETKYHFSELHLKLTDLLITLIKQNKSDRILGNNYRERWANDIRLTEEVDKRSIDRIKKVIEFSQRDSFWKQNILSGSKLRKQFDKLEIQRKEELGGSKQNRQHYQTDKSRKEDKFGDLYET